LETFRPAVEALESRLTPSVSFAAQQTFAAGARPQALAVGDFNGDGRPDLVVANFNDGTVSVFLNTAPAGAAAPTFAAPQTVVVGSFPASVVVADFNGDGRPDIAVANDVATGTMSVLLNTSAAGAGVPTFAAAQTFAVGPNPQSIAAGDFNRDGRPDLVVANFGGSTVSVLLDTTTAGAAAPTFAAQQTFSVGANPQSVAVADFNNDGRPDLAAANFGGNTISILLDTTAVGAGTTSFAAQQTFAAGTNPQMLAAGDFNADGRPDLAFTDANSGAASVLLDTTAPGAIIPSFSAQETFALGAGPTAVAVADFSGDGRPDLAVANFTDKTVSVLVNTTAAGATAATFAAQQTFATGAGPQGAAAADFNADGRPDLVVVNQGDNTVSVLLNTTAAFPTTTPVLVGQFGSTGVWEYNRATNAWGQLTAANASVLAADPLGDVAAVFPGYGVLLFRPAAGWKQIHPLDASLLAMDALGDVFAEFPGFGVGEFQPSAGWKLLTTANASLLAADALGDAAAVFPGYGVQLYRPSTGWRQINGVDATLLAMDPQGDVVANFKGIGVGEYQQASGWKLLNGTEATALAANALGEVVASFAGLGVGEYLPTFGWRQLLPNSAGLLAIDFNGSVYGEFAGFGVWQADPYRFATQLRTSDASLLIVA
jgi:hypothetical protein